MLYLINKKQKDKILDTYYATLINLFSFSLFCLFIIFMVFLFPTYLTMRVDREIISDRVLSLKTEIDSYNDINKTNENIDIDNDISILAVSTTDNTLDIYEEIKYIYQTMPNVKLTAINIDTSTKKITINAIIDNKNTANLIVDKLNNSNYKGAELPYSVFSQNKSFIFNQNLTYE